MKYLSFSDFNQQVNSDFCGGVWISPQSNLRSHPHFNLLDYYYDGLLSKTIEKAKPNRPHLYLTKQFNNPFFLIHLQDESQLRENIDQTTDVLRKVPSKDKKIFLIDDLKVSKELIRNYEKKLSGFHFHALN